jgi:Arc/MetJ family transcription regulator
MRLTINLDDDLYAMARSHAIATKTSISKAVGDLLRRRTLAATPLPSSSLGIHPLSRFPVSQSEGRSITSEDTRRAMDDDLVNPLEIMGLTPTEIEEASK